MNLEIKCFVTIVKVDSHVMQDGTFKFLLFDKNILQNASKTWFNKFLFEHNV